MEDIDDLRHSRQSPQCLSPGEGHLSPTHHSLSHETDTETMDNMKLADGEDSEVPIIEPEAVPDGSDELMHEDLDTSGANPVRVKPKAASLRLQTRGGRMRADQVSFIIPSII